MIETFFVNKQISYFFLLRCFLSLINLMSMNFKLINLMSINVKLINLMSTNFVNMQISYFFPLKLLFFIETFFVNKQISYFFPLQSFLMFFGAFWCFFVHVNYYRKRNRKFKTGLMTSFILLLKKK